MTDSRIAPLGSATYYTGAGYTPEVNWQIPAVGTRTLSPTEARALADWLDGAADPDGWLAFILLDDDPSTVAEELRAAADASVRDSIERQEAAERHQNGLLRDDEEGED